MESDRSNKLSRLPIACRDADSASVDIDQADWPRRPHGRLDCGRKFGLNRICRCRRTVVLKERIEFEIFVILFVSLLALVYILVFRQFVWILCLRIFHVHFESGKIGSEPVEPVSYPSNGLQPKIGTESMAIGAHAAPTQLLRHEHRQRGEQLNVSDLRIVITNLGLVLIIEIDDPVFAAQLHRLVVWTI